MQPPAAAIVDVDGTIVRGDTLIPGAAEGLQKLEEAGCSLLLFSNNPTRGAPYYRDKLSRHGIDVDSDRVLTSASVTAAFLAEEHATDRIYLVGEARLRAILEDAALPLSSDPGTADLVLGSIDRQFSYDVLSSALDALARGVPFYGTDPDVTIPSEAGREPGSGAVLAALSAVADREPDAILGKPSKIAAEAALSRLETRPSETLVIGDRLDTDIALGQSAGMRTALVRTGITDDDALATSTIEPDVVLDSLADVGSVL